MAALAEHGEVVERHRPAFGYGNDVVDSQALRGPAANALVTITL